MDQILIEFAALLTDYHVFNMPLMTAETSMTVVRHIGMALVEARIFEHTGKYTADGTVLLKLPTYKRLVQETIKASQSEEVAAKVKELAEEKEMDVESTSEAMIVLSIQNILLLEKLNKLIDQVKQEPSGPILT